MDVLPQALAALAAYRQFIVYRLSPRGTSGKLDKLPIDPRTGAVSNAHDPAIWLSADEAIAHADRLGADHGVGFVFTAADPFVFADLDNCLLPDNTWSPLAVELCTRLAGAAVEVSQSGRGLHIIGSALAVPPHGCKNVPLGLELYHEGRFVALTGTHATGDAGADLTLPLLDVIETHFPPTATSSRTAPAEWTTEPLPAWRGPTDDDALIARMLASTGNQAARVFGGATRASVADLWNADPQALGRAYPDTAGGQGRAYDASSADAALAAHLAFWTGGNCERMERLMRRSALARDKWDRHGSYLSRTILGAVARCDQVYTGGERRETVTSAQTLPSLPEPAIAVRPEVATGLQFLSADQQIDHFQGCVYVQDVHRVFTPSGALLRPDQFRATFGGYLFAIDNTNTKTTKCPWEAFTQSQAVRYPIAEGLTFRPELQPGELITEEGRLLVNTYVPAHVDRRPGDVTPFLNHLRKILPDENDAAILLAYMAAVVQHIGVKFQWAPLLQGVEGNGKTLFTRCVAHAVGTMYSHFPKAREVSNKFNSWMVRKIFIGIEDVYYPQDQREIVEELKPMITNDILPIEFKGVDQISVHVCANFMLNSNHKDAIRKTRNDRRFCTFFTAQQQASDVIRDGMGGDYFPDLYQWLRRGGYAHVAEYLATYPIPDELNPATKCHRAPVTSTTEQAIAHGVGSIEQEIIEAIGEGRPGFSGGWVSSRALDRLLESMRMSRAISPNRRRELMQSLGYDWHPALHDGRVNNPIAIDGGSKPRLYIKSGHPDLALTSPAAVAKAYQDVQSGGAAAAFGIDGAVN